MELPPLTASQERVAPLPTMPDVGTPIEDALRATGNDLLTCRAEKQDLVVTYQTLRALLSARR